jgi:hypothetical protein
VRNPFQIVCAGEPEMIRKRDLFPENHLQLPMQSTCVSPLHPAGGGVIRHVPHLVVVAVVDVDQNGRVTGSFQNTHLGDRFEVPK